MIDSESNILGITSDMGIDQMAEVCAQYDICWGLDVLNPGNCQCWSTPDWGSGCGDEASAYGFKTPREAFYQSLMNLIDLHGSSLVDEAVA